MSTTERKAPVYVGTVRWTVVERYSDGTLYAEAYSDPHDPHGSFLARVEMPAGSTEIQVFDALRGQICKALRITADRVVNSAGQEI